MFRLIPFTFNILSYLVHCIYLFLGQGGLPVLVGKPYEDIRVQITHESRTIIV